MAQAAVASTNLASAIAAGAHLGRQVRNELGEKPDAVLLFAAPHYDHAALLEAFHDECAPKVLAGASSAGEFIGADAAVGGACVVALRAPEMHFAVGVGRRLSSDRERAARDVVASFAGLTRHEFLHRTAIVLADALAGEADALVETLAALTGGLHQFAGGGAGGDDQFQRRSVFAGREVIPDGIVALEILSHKPVGLGARHGWKPVGERYRVTQADGMRLGSLNLLPAADVFEQHAEQSSQRFDRKEPLPFFLHNIIGVENQGGYKLRVPLGVEQDGTVACATEIPQGAAVRLMSVNVEQAADAARQSVRDALASLGDHKPAVGIMFDCVATRLRMGSEFATELRAVQDALGGDVKFAGCNTIGQIARAEGTFSGFHNCTAVVCVVPA